MEYGRVRRGREYTYGSEKDGLRSLYVGRSERGGEAKSCIYDDIDKGIVISLQIACPLVEARTNTEKVI